MMTFATAWRVLFPIIGAVAIVGALWFQHRQIGHQRELIRAMQQSVAQSRAALQAMDDMGKRVHQQTMDLMQAQQRVQSSLTARQIEIRRLQTDVQEIRDWADQPLPADIQRMLKHPAATGARGYAAPVPAGDPLHDVRSSPENQR